MGCGSRDKQETMPANDTTKNNDGAEDKKPDKKPQEKEIPYVEIWRENVGYLEVKKDGPQSQFFIDNVGIGVYSPYVPWEGGDAYIQKLNTLTATGDIPDMFLPWKGNEITLAQQGAIADLTDYLPEYAPNVWQAIPEHVWDIVRAADPKGEGRIYYIPSVQLYNDYGPFIRTDWLDRVGMDMPTTKDELVKVLRAFKELDANGNGNADDEIPTSGREFGRWMDYLFGIYGIAMSEGYPNWDVYDGELTYSAVTPNMKEAIEFIRGLYKEGLLDNETFLNSSSDWKAKITSDKVGIWYHLSQYSHSRFEAITQLNPDATFAALPNVTNEGYDSFITHLDIKRPEYVIANKSEETIINALKLLNFAFDSQNRELNTFRVEGIDYEVVNGEKVLLPKDKSTSENVLLATPRITEEDLFFNTEIMLNSVSEDRKPMFETQLAVQESFQDLDKRIAGDGLPNTIYDGYSDIQQHTLYQEYMTRIIIGDWEMDKFDEFVELWHQNGGEAVTKRAREWYSKVR